MALESYFFDTYALVELIVGNPNYERFKEVPFTTTRLNLMELYYGLAIKYGQSKAEKYFKRFKEFCTEFDDETLRLAMIFRAQNKKKKFSYVDCISYMIALRRRMKFLTGDKGFRGLPNVEYVK